MVRRMAFALPQSLLALLLTVAVGGSAALAQAPAASPAEQPTPADAVDTSLSPECRVPGSKLYTLGPLRAVKRALKESRAIQVLGQVVPSASELGIDVARGPDPGRGEAGHQAVDAAKALGGLVRGERTVHGGGLPARVVDDDHRVGMRGRGWADVGR